MQRHGPLSSKLSCRLMMHQYGQYGDFTASLDKEMEDSYGFEQFSLQDVEVYHRQN